MKKIKLMLFVSISILFIMPVIVFAADNVICVDGASYDVINKGEYVTDIYTITSENINNQSILASEYFDMEKYFNELKLTIDKVDSYLETYENNKKLNNNNGVLDTDIKKFLDKYYSVYTNKKYYQVLSNKKEKAKYFVEVTSLKKSCTLTNENGKYVVNICPTVKITEVYNSINFNNSVSKVTFNNDKKVFEYTISDSFTSDITNEKVSFNGNLVVREVKVPVTLNENSNTIIDISLANINRDGVNLSSLDNKGNIFNLDKGKKVTRTLNQGETIYLEFYLKEDATGDCSSCRGSYLGYLIFSAPTYAKIENPFYNSSTCVNLRNNSQNETYKRAYVYDCYRKEVEYFSEIKSGSISINTILNDIDNLNSVLSMGEEVDNSIKSNYCVYNKDDAQQSNSATKRYVYNPNNSEYWAADCTETVTVSYDAPKKTIAGSGFSYNAKIEVKRTCKPIVLKKVESLPACEYSVECYGGPSTNRHDGGPGAGPSDDFDSCIYNCDLGAYSKDCINACYNSVYKNDDSAISKMFSFIDEVKAKSLVNSDVSSTKVVRLSNNYKEGDTTSRGNIVIGVGPSSNSDSRCNKATQTCTSPVTGITYPYSNLCNGASPVVCYDVQLSSNCGGANEKEKEKSENDYKALIEALKTYTESETSELSIIDSYKKNEAKTDLLKTTWTSKDLLNSKVEVSKFQEEVTGSKLYYTDNDTKDISKYTVGKKYEIEIPQAYVDVLTSSVRYVKSDVSRESDERNGGNKYYTDIKTGAFNLYYPNDWTFNLKHSMDASLSSNYLGNNIKVVFKNIGTNLSDKSYTWDVINVDCFYGVYNQINIQCEPPVCDEDSSDNPTPTDGPSDNFPSYGLQYMFRQVNLEDLFPDRSPFYNWNTDSAKKITEEIELKGNNAYSDENLEYDFTITKSQIKKIRSYNKKAKSYQDYPDMECSTKSDGRIECISKFMTDANYITRNK